MAHPHANIRQNKVERSRVSHITKGYKSGGAVHSDEKADRKLFGKMIREHDRDVEGKGKKHRHDKPHRAHGGKVGRKSKGATHVNVIVNGGDKSPPPAMVPPMMAPPPGGPPPGPVAGLGGPPPPGAMPPPGMPPRKRGGRVTGGVHAKSGPAWEEGKRLGTQVQHSDGKGTANTKANLDRGRPVTFKAGGVVKSFYARGGAVEANGKPGKQMGPKLPGGIMAGETRIAQAGRAKRDYAKPMKETDGAR